ncbi:MAG: TIGR04066 family peptide maturation system protein [Oscillospiraceae bacterium]
MKRLKNVMIYPFREQHISTVKYLSAFHESFTVGAVCAPTGLGLIGKDVSHVANRDPLGIIVEGDPKQALDKNDMLLILSETDDVVRRLAVDLMIDAANQKKDIFCLMELSDEENDKLEALCKANNCLFECNLSSVDNQILNKTIGYRKKIYKPSVPVMFVGGLIESADQMEILVGMTNELRQKGYRVSAFGNGEACNFLGLHSYKFILNTENAPKMIKQLNHFVQEVEEDESPDIILIQVPGAMLRYNDVLTGDFGIYTYLFSQAFIPDYFICCSMYDILEESFFKMVSSDFERRFGFKVDGIHPSNQLIDSMDSIQKKEIVCVHVSQNQLENTLENLKKNASIPVYNLLHKIQQECAVEDMLTSLAGN